MSRPQKIILIAVATIGAVVAVAYLLPSDLGRKPDSNPEHPAVILHRAGSAHWIQNTLGAVRGALARDVKAIEVDVVLTADGVPVLSHDPWVHDELCTRVDGSRIDPRVLIKDVALADLRRDFVCGGVKDRAFPEAELVPGPIATLDEVIAELRGRPGVTLYLDVKVEPPDTADAKAYAAAIFSRWRAARLPNRFLVEGPDATAVAAWREAAGDQEFTALLSAPPFPASSNHTTIAIVHRARTRFMPSSDVRAAREAGADGMVSPMQSLRWPTVVGAIEAGQQVIVYGPANQRTFDRYCDWPVTAIIIDDIDFGSCGAKRAP